VQAWKDHKASVIQSIVLETAARVKFHQRTKKLWSLQGRASKLRSKFWRTHTSSITKSHEHEWQKKLEDLWNEQLSAIRQKNSARDNYRAAMWNRHCFQQGVIRCSASLSENKFKSKRNDADILHRSTVAGMVERVEREHPCSKQDLWGEYHTANEKWNMEWQQRRTAASIGRARIDRKKREQQKPEAEKARKASDESSDESVHEEDDDDEDEGEKDDANREEDGNDRYSNKYNDLVGFKYVNSDSDDEEEYEEEGYENSDSEEVSEEDEMLELELEADREEEEEEEGKKEPATKSTQPPDESPTTSFSLGGGSSMGSVPAFTFDSNAGTAPTFSFGAGTAATFSAGSSSPDQQQAAAARRGSGRGRRGKGSKMSL
jgi:hypothetical protein